jgi:hypothetical protein
VAVPYYYFYPLVLSSVGLVHAYYWDVEDPFLACLAPNDPFLLCSALAALYLGSRSSVAAVAKPFQETDLGEVLAVHYYYYSVVHHRHALGILGHEAVAAHQEPSFVRQEVRSGLLETVSSFSTDETPSES